MAEIVKPNVFKVFFLCTGNSCRSQMAEGWTRYLHAQTIEPFSAGVVRQGLDQRAVQVMAEAGVDIKGQSSKTVEDLPETYFDMVITLCDQANESCPYFPGRFVGLHKSFDDPPSLAFSSADSESALEHYRRVKDEIRDFADNLPSILSEQSR